MYFGSFNQSALITSPSTIPIRKVSLPTYKAKILYTCWKVHYMGFLLVSLSPNVYEAHMFNTYLETVQCYLSH